MDDLVESDISVEELLKQREAASKKNQNPPQSITLITKKPANKTSADIVPYKPRPGALPTTSVWLTPAEYHAMKEKDRMPPPEVTIAHGIYLLECRVMGREQAQIQRDLRREVRRCEIVKKMPRWRQDLSYQTLQEELKFGVFLDAERLRVVAEPKGAHRIEILIFKGKTLCYYPRTNKHGEGAWNPKHRGRTDWNFLDLLIHYWDIYKERGVRLHTENGSTKPCVDKECNCFINGKHVSEYDTVYVDNNYLKGIGMWFYDHDTDHEREIQYPYNIYNAARHE